MRNANFFLLGVLLGIAIFGCAMQPRVPADYEKRSPETVTSHRSGFDDEWVADRQRSARDWWVCKSLDNWRKCH